jgi:formate dehydrogenase maturation protein FdhE
MPVPTLTYDSYCRQFPAAQRALTFHDELRRLMRDTQDLPALPHLGIAVVEEAWQSGRPIVGRMSLGPRAEPLRKVLRLVTKVMQQHLPQVGGLDVLADPGRMSDAQLLDLANEVVSGQPQGPQPGAKVAGAHPTGVAYAMSLAVSAFYIAVRRHLPADLDFGIWQRQTCPVCAAAPSVARIRADGGREAFCHRCLTQWSLPADLCGICGDRDARQRVRLDMPGDPARRAEVCRSCRQVTKLVDERALGAVSDLYLEDVVMLPLDDLARDAASRMEERVLIAR